MTADRWSDAVLAATLALVDPRGLGGVWLRARHGPVRDRWISEVQALAPPLAPKRRIAATIDADRLLGGLDFAATLAAGRSVMETGVLPSVSDGMLLVAMAERLPRRSAALIAGALDRGSVRIEREGFSIELAARFVLFALDEGIDEEAIPTMLAERLAFRVDLDGLSIASTGSSPFDCDAILQARRGLPSVAIPDRLIEALTVAALRAGRSSQRTALFLCRAARAAAALRGAAIADLEDAVVAARLVVGPSIAAEQSEPERQQADETPDRQEPETADNQGSGDLAETIVEAVAASLPEGLLEMARASTTSRDPAQTGRSSEDGAGTRGRAIGISPTKPRPDARIDLLATLRTAAPWQAVRRRGDRLASPESRGTGERLRVTADDFRYVRRQQKQGTTAIFAVDASGSAAAARLAESKGAIELLLAECYVRRDEVALIAFRGTTSETLLEPTRSLVRAKRSLASLPGGGPTPLAHGIAAVTRMAHGLGRRGKNTIAVFLTDGRGNVALDGRPLREAAMEDATAAARRFRALGLRGVVIDTGRRPQAALGELAAELGADYVVLPRGGSERISAELVARLRT